MQGLEAYSKIEMSVLSKYYCRIAFFLHSRYFFYQLWNILFVVVVSSTVYKSIFEIQTPRDVIEILGNSLPQASSTLINYTMLCALAVYPAQLLLVGPFILSWLYRIVAVLRWKSSEVGPREVSDTYYPSLLTSINYGCVYPIPILIWYV